MRPDRGRRPPTVAVEPCGRQSHAPLLAVAPERAPVLASAPSGHPRTATFLWPTPSAPSSPFSTRPPRPPAASAAGGHPVRPLPNGWWSVTLVTYERLNERTLGGHR